MWLISENCQNFVVIITFLTILQDNNKIKKYIYYTTFHTQKCLQQQKKEKKRYLSFQNVINVL